MKSAVAIVGMACSFPDANSPLELWQNALAQRRAFRRFPRQRLPLADYYSSQREDPDRTYSKMAALIEGYSFDRMRFRISAQILQSADWTHWLALDVAGRALEDAGWAQGRGMPRQSTGVILGNTLTGEFSRANALRLRWPYIRRVVEAELMELGWPRSQRGDFLEKLGRSYKSRFPAVNEETLAGGLSNTIAGRICNHFDFQGAGFTMDGACASSLLAVANACSALENGDLDVALSGGVDLSLDPFELVGFAKTSALAAEEMLVYDARSDGFLPGEGCGILALMRLEDALEEKREIAAVIRGWGISADGSGGLTRPETEGQRLALERAYLRAGFGIDSVACFEGHGTGTPVGDATELQTLSEARLEANRRAPPAAISSIKANIGHTKAAAGAAGLIKAAMALKAQIVPPSVGCRTPHPLLNKKPAALRILKAPEPWPANQKLRAAVSSMGFGGINVHLTLERERTPRRRVWTASESSLASSVQDCEAFLFHAGSRRQLLEKLESLAVRAAELSFSELTDLSESLRRKARRGKVRASVVADSPGRLRQKLLSLSDGLKEDRDERFDFREGIFFSQRAQPPRIGFLFPGQGSPLHACGGAWARRLELVKHFYDSITLPKPESRYDTAFAQPAVVAASAAALQTMERLGIQAEVAVGHSVGELTALHWAGAVDAAALLRIAVCRGEAMSAEAKRGAMAALEADAETVQGLLPGTEVVIAGLNSPKQTVVSGEKTAVSRLLGQVRRKGIRAVRLPVSHAFHSELIAPSAASVAQALAGERFRPLRRQVVSTITGRRFERNAEIPALLVQQMTSPVRFQEAISEASREVDWWIEVGPGEVLTQLMFEHFKIPCLALDACGDSLKGVLLAVAAAYAAGIPGAARGLPGKRFSREIDLDRELRFFSNPCEAVPQLAETKHEVGPTREGPELGEKTREPANALEVFSRQVARQVQLPRSSIQPDSRLLGDLHLNSITVGQIVAKTARELGMPPPISPAEFARATVAEAARALEDLRRTSGSDRTSEDPFPAGIEPWIRAFSVELLERARPRRRPSLGQGSWLLLASDAHPIKLPLASELASLGGGGVVVCLRPEEDPVELFLSGARALSNPEHSGFFVLVHHQSEAAAMARTLHLERPDLTTCVVDIPPHDPAAAPRICSEIRSASGYFEVHYNQEGSRKEPFLCPLNLEEYPNSPGLTASDVLAVTGGGKGIAAECAFHLASRSGCRLGLMGRSDPNRDQELHRNLDRLSAAGIDFDYQQANVADRRSVGRAVGRLKRRWGPVSAVLHGAGANRPRLLSELEAEDFQETLAPKVDGLANLLSAVDGKKLRWLIGFGSIIARIGLPGEADYAFANARLARQVDRWRRKHPHCRCLNVEWSLWSGVGMGQRLGRVEVLRRQGVTPIAPEEGVDWLERLLKSRLPCSSVVVTGRFGAPPTLRLKPSELPFLRFLEKPLIHYPEIELVARSELSSRKDPYLEDHAFEGNRLFPAVMGLEAMAQAARGLIAEDDRIVFERVNFSRPVAVPADGSLKVRTLACRCADEVKIALRSAETEFQADHFQAVCRIVPRPLKLKRSTPDFPPFRPPIPAVSLDTSRELYGPLLFQRGRFQRVSGYRLLEARRCVAEISLGSTENWFGPYLAPELALGDPGLRDAALHAIQACIPQAVLLPTAADAIICGERPTDGPFLVRALERSQRGDLFVWDLEIGDSEGQVFERWEGLKLKTMATQPADFRTAPALLGPYLQRRLDEVFGEDRMCVAVQRNGQGDRRQGSQEAFERALGHTCKIRYRADGRPDAVNGRCVSASHLGDLALAAAGPGPIGCDFEAIRKRPKKLWEDLLGKEGLALAELITREAGEVLSAAATRVWAGQESLKKASSTETRQMTLGRCWGDCVLLGAGRLQVATFSAAWEEGRAVLAFALAPDARNAAKG